MREITPLLQIRQVAHLVEHHMQPARAPRAKEHTNNPVQRPNFRGQGTKQGTPWLDSSPQTPLVHRDNSGQENKRTSVDLARGKVSGGSRQKAVVGRTSLGGSLCREQRHPCPGEPNPRLIATSLGGSLFREWTHPFPGEPIPRLSTTSLGGSLSSEWTQPFTGEPIPRLSTMLSSPELNC